MNDQPRAEDLLRAVERFLEQQVVGQLQGPARFHARVAANVVAMVAREIETEDLHASGEWERLGALLEKGDAARPTAREALREEVRQWNLELVERIRAGDADSGPLRRDVLAHLRQVAADKMEVSRPPRQKQPSA